MVIFATDDGVNIVRDVAVPIMVAVVGGAIGPLIQRWNDAKKLRESKPVAGSGTRGNLFFRRTFIFVLIGVPVFFGYRQFLPRGPVIRPRPTPIERPTPVGSVGLRWIPLLDAAGRPQAMTKTQKTPNIMGKGPDNPAAVSYRFECPENRRFIVGQEKIEIDDKAAAAQSDCLKTVPGHAPGAGQIRISPDGREIEIVYHQWGRSFMLTFGANVEELR